MRRLNDNHALSPSHGKTWHETNRDPALRAWEWVNVCVCVCVCVPLGPLVQAGAAHSEAALLVSVIERQKSVWTEALITQKTLQLKTNRSIRKHMSLTIPSPTLVIYWTKSFLKGSLQRMNHMAITWWARDTMYWLNLQRMKEKQENTPFKIIQLMEAAFIWLENTVKSVILWNIITV